MSVPLKPSTVGLRTRRRMLFATALLLGAAALWPGLRPAHAANAATVVEAVQLPAWVERSGQRRPAQPGQLLRNGDKAVTDNGARMLLRMPDRSVIKLGEATQLRIDTLVERQQTAAGSTYIKAGLRLITGVFRYATDYTSKALGHQRELSLQLTTATVGIRGTDFWAMTDPEHDAVCLFDGQVAVERSDRPEIDLAKPGAFWVVFTGQPEQPAGQATPDQLAKFIDQAEMKPGQGIMLQGGRWRTVVGLYASASQAGALRERLREAGFPAEMVLKNGRYELRINQLATEADAQAVLERLRAVPEWGVREGRVALAAA